MFKTSGAYTETDKDIFDVLIVDEAHCLTEKSGLFNSYGENQIKEIIHSLCDSLQELKLFAIDDSINEAGFVHSAHGLEFDYVRIIIKEYSFYEDSKICTNFQKPASSYSSFKGIKKFIKRMI